MRISERIEPFPKDLSSLRVAFTGTGGAGKTTTLNALYTYLLGKYYSHTKYDVEEDVTPDAVTAFAKSCLPPLLPSTSREVMQRLGVTDKNQHTLTKEESINLQRHILEARLTKEVEMGEGFISDRCILDHKVYIDYFNQGTDLQDYATGVLLTNLRRYDLIIFTPISPSWYENNVMADDNLRSMDVDYLRTIHNAIEEDLSAIEPKLDQGTVLRLEPNTSVENRVSAVVIAMLEAYERKRVKELNPSITP